MLALMMRMPKPGADGAEVDGPPCSVQRSTRFPDAVDQSSDSRPVRVDSAPYFAALVTSSCTASARHCAAAEPERHVGTGGDDARRVGRAVGRQFLLDEAAQIGALPARQRQDGVGERQRSGQPSTAVVNSSMVGARVSRTIDCTTASAFLAR